MPPLAIFRAHPTRKTLRNTLTLILITLTLTLPLLSHTNPHRRTTTLTLNPHPSKPPPLHKQNHPLSRHLHALISKHRLHTLLHTPCTPITTSSIINPLLDNINIQQQQAHNTPKQSKHQSAIVTPIHTTRRNVHHPTYANIPRRQNGPRNTPLRHVCAHPIAKTLHAARNALAQSQQTTFSTTSESTTHTKESNNNNNNNPPTITTTIFLQANITPSAQKETHPLHHPLTAAVLLAPFLNPFSNLKHDIRNESTTMKTTTTKKTLSQLSYPPFTPTTHYTQFPPSQPPHAHALATLRLARAVGARFAIAPVPSSTFGRLRHTRDMAAIFSAGGGSDDMNGEGEAVGGEDGLAGRVMVEMLSTAHRLEGVVADGEAGVHWFTYEISHEGSM